ncbi:hypothetical protein ACI65C_006230 [Semiaphis heraclei]
MIVVPPIGLLRRWVTGVSRSKSNAFVSAVRAERRVRSLALSAYDFQQTIHNTTTRILSVLLVGSTGCGLVVLLLAARPPRLVSRQCILCRAIRYLSHVLVPSPDTSPSVTSQSLLQILFILSGIYERRRQPYQYILHNHCEP